MCARVVGGKARLFVVVAGGDASEKTSICDDLMYPLWGRVSSSRIYLKTSPMHNKQHEEKKQYEARDTGLHYLLGTNLHIYTSSIASFQKDGQTIWFSKLKWRERLDDS